MSLEMKAVRLTLYRLTCTECGAAFDIRNKARAKNFVQDECPRCSFERYDARRSAERERLEWSLATAGCIIATTGAGIAGFIAATTEGIDARAKP